MNYGTWIISLAFINIITVFSGLPTGTKKLVFIVTTLALLAIGFMLRAIEKRRTSRILEKKQRIEELSREELDQVATRVANDLEEQIEGEIDEITSKHPTFE
jgi:Flp pilus assembly protein TadB